MKFFHPNHRYFLLVSIILIQSCTLVPGVRKNEDIKSSKREKFHQMNNEVLQHLKAGETASLKMMLCDSLKKQSMTKLEDSISQQLKQNEYGLLDEYYVINKYADYDTIRVSGPLENRYGLMYPYVTFEEYFAFFLPKHSDNKYMISLNYGNFKDGWKLINISLKPYTIGGRTGPELYQQARQDYDNGNYPAAADAAKKAMMTMKPFAYWQYPDLEDATTFYKKTLAYIAYYNLPFILQKVDTGPLILNITDTYTPDGVFPLVTYMTHYDIANAAAVKKENQAINVQISKMLPGLGKHYAFVYYSAYNQNPAANPGASHLDMKVKPVITNVQVLPE